MCRTHVMSSKTGSPGNQSHQVLFLGPSIQSRLLISPYRRPRSKHMSSGTSPSLVPSTAAINHQAYLHKSSRALLSLLSTPAPRPPSRRLLSTRAGIASQRPLFCPSVASPAASYLHLDEYSQGASVIHQPLSSALLRPRGSSILPFLLMFTPL